MGLLNATQPFILMGDTNLDYFSHKELKSLADTTGILLHQMYSATLRQDMENELAPYVT